jgi:hypothetical protein
VNRVSRFETGTRPFFSKKNPQHSVSIGWRHFLTITTYVQQKGLPPQMSDQAKATTEPPQPKPPVPLATLPPVQANRRPKTRPPPATSWCPPWAVFVGCVALLLGVKMHFWPAPRPTSTAAPSDNWQSTLPLETYNSHNSGYNNKWM